MKRAWNVRYKHGGSSCGDHEVRSDERLFFSADEPSKEDMLAYVEEHILAFSPLEQSQAVITHIRETGLHGIRVEKLSALEVQSLLG